jgi:phenylalanyl-tRNA synthetase alpha chain
MSESQDIDLPILKNITGSLHPMSLMLDYITNVLLKMGFQTVQGPEIETEEFNFDMLNIKKNHPARQMHDTFYVSDKAYVLRTHTSPVQIRGMLDKKPPIALISAGKVYRKDDDSTHLPMFHQIEGIYVSKDVSFSNLKDVIYKILHSIFGESIDIRFRPSYFPFTEPSAEVDILSEDGKWLEVLGCGVVNPVVIKNCGIDENNYSGFAFGLGVERMAMLKFGVSDIRDFYKSNLDFLDQFK